VNIVLILVIMKILKRKTFKTQTELAKALGVSRSHISYLVRGSRQPSLELLRVIKKELGITFDGAVNAIATGFKLFLEKSKKHVDKE